MYICPISIDLYKEKTFCLSCPFPRLSSAYFFLLLWKKDLFHILFNDANIHFFCECKIVWPCYCQNGYHPFAYVQRLLYCSCYGDCQFCIVWWWKEIIFDKMFALRIIRYNSVSLFFIYISLLVFYVLFMYINKWVSLC